MKNLILVTLLFVLAGCTAMPPKNTDNLCATFLEKGDWYDDAVQSYKRWGIPVAVQMAIMHQESHFVADAKPPRDWLLGFIPLSRPSSAYGYAQVKDETWEDYLNSAGSWWSDRDDFADAADFIGWYSHISNTKLGIAKADAKNLYLAYHEGHRGYQRKSYLKKAGLERIADKVAKQAQRFQNQLSRCRMN
jgi:hypothetical protein